MKQIVLLQDGAERTLVSQYPEGPINLREELKAEIPSTTYLTHAIHNVYPAKFIPQVPRYVIKTFNLRGKVILDPFAGSGTTAVEGLITGNSVVSNDINPLTTFLTDIKTLKLDYSDYLTYLNRLTYLVDSIFKSNSKFMPRWRNIEYWYPEAILKLLTKVWGGIYEIDDSELMLKKLLQAGALFLCRKYSYGEDKSPKLFKSKQKAVRIKELLAKFGRYGEQLLQNELFKKTKEYLDCVNKLNSNYDLCYKKLNELKRNNEEVFLITLAKSLSELEHVIPEGSVDCIVTSPPYMYAQEYLRSTKIDLYWLNLVDDEGVRELTSKEIGQKSKAFYSNGLLSSIQTYAYDLEVIKNLSQHFKTKENINRFTAYFSDMLYFIQLSERLLCPKGILAIFVGEPKVFGHHVRVKDVFIEMMAQSGFNVKGAYFDTIKGRHLSKNRLNVNPEGISGEWLILGEKL